MQISLMAEPWILAEPTLSWPGGSAPRPVFFCVVVERQFWNRQLSNCYICCEISEDKIGGCCGFFGCPLNPSKSLHLWSNLLDKAAAAAGGRASSAILQRPLVPEMRWWCGGRPARAGWSWKIPPSKMDETWGYKAVDTSIEFHRSRWMFGMFWSWYR